MNTLRATTRNLHILHARNACAPCANQLLTSTTQPEHHRNFDKYTSQIAKFNVTQRRYCSNQSDDGNRSGPPAVKLPALMQFPEIVWPSLIKSIRNFILATFIVRPYLDRDFNLPDFVGGAKHALEVSKFLLVSM